MLTDSDPLVTLVPHGLSHDGRAVARLNDGLTVFVPHALPGQTVRARLVKRKKRLAEAELVAILAPAPEERPAPCPHYLLCGGCSWQGLPYEQQCSWKRQLLYDALTRIGHVPLTLADVPPVLPAAALPEAEWGYRNKMEFSFGRNHQGNTVLGLVRRASREIVEVTHCLLQTSRTMRILASLRELTAQAGLEAWEPRPGSANAILRFAVIREPLAGRGPNDTGPCLVELITAPVHPASPQAQAVRTLGQALLASGLATMVVHSLRGSPAAVAYGEKTLFLLEEETGSHTAPGLLREELRLTAYPQALSFYLNHATFFQVNTRGAEVLYATAASLASGYGEGGECWDIYCGVGGLSLALAPWFEKVLGVETVESSVRLARKNAAPYEKIGFERAEAHCLADFLPRYSRPRLICTDPPRGGLDKAAMDALLGIRPELLLMISCNPATLARDLERLQEHYRLEAVRGVDLFPQTPHVEAVALLKKRT